MASDSPKEGRTTPEEILWRAHPLKENVWRSLLLAAIMAVTCYGAWVWTGWPGMAVLAAVILAVSMAPFLFPTRYRMDGEGIEIVFLGVRTFRPWDELRNFYPHDVGVHLSTFKRPNALDPFRGSFIRFAPGNGEEVLTFLRAHIRRDKGEAEGGPSQSDGARSAEER